MWVVYEFILFIGLLCYLPKALWRRRLPHAGWSMRLGRYPPHITERLQGRETIWIHAVSVGEIMAIQPLVREFHASDPDRVVVISTVTPSGFAVALRLFGKDSVVIYSPLDFRLTVRRALRTIHPRALLLVESELWPMLIRLAKQQRIPVAVVNGRISERAYRRYLWVRPWLNGMLGSIDGFLMQTDVDAERIVSMGAPAARVRVLGSLKWDASLTTRPSQDDCEAFAKRLGLAPEDVVIVAGSTHRGEEQALLDAVQAIQRQGTRVKLVIAPRHLERVGEVEALIRDRGMTVQPASLITPASPSWDVAIVDTLGQLPLYYAVATVVFVGGSLIPHGGQNPIEPASLGKPVVFGSFMQNFAEITQQLLADQAAHQVRDRSALPTILLELSSDRPRALAMGQRAQDVVARLSGTSRRTRDALSSLLTGHPSST